MRYVFLLFPKWKLNANDAVAQDNVICPRDVMTLPETRFSVHSCLSDFRSVKLAPSGDTSQDVEAYGRLVVEVSG